MTPIWKFILLITPFLVGLLLPIQGGINNKLGQALQNPLPASFFSFLGGTLVLDLALVLTEYSFPKDLNLLSIPAPYWLGGLCGAIFVTSVIYIAPKIGLVPFLSISLLGQFFMGAIIDHMGWLGINKSEFNLQKTLGIAAILVGVYLVQASKASA